MTVCGADVTFIGGRVQKELFVERRRVAVETGPSDFRGTGGAAGPRRAPRCSSKLRRREGAKSAPCSSVNVDKFELNCRHCNVHTVPIAV